MRARCFALARRLVDIGRIEKVGDESHAFEQLQPPRRSAGQNELDGTLGHRVLLEPVVDPALGQIVGRHFDHDAIAGQDTDAVLAHLSGGVGNDFMVVVELHAKRRVGQKLGNGAFEFQQFFLGHVTP